MDFYLLVFFALMFAVGSTGAIFRPGDWYEQLNRPSWTPPNWAFPVVWTSLYIMIAFAGWIVWHRTGATSLPMAFWGAQLVLNAAWSWLFFGQRRMDLALIDVSLLWLTIAGFIVTAWPISQLASLLFVPYLVWVTIASALNYRMITLNRDSVESFI